MRTSWWVVGFAVVPMGATLTAGSFGTGLEAQQVDEARVTFEVRAGYEDPTRALGRTGLLRNDQTGWGYALFDEVEPAPFVGGGLRAGLTRGLSLRVTLDYGFGSTVDGQWFCDAFSPCPAVLQSLDGTVERWSAGGDLVLELPELGLPVTPHVYLGAVRRSHSLRWSAPIPELPIPTAYDQASWHLRPGFGLSREVGRIRVFGEAEALLGSAFGDARPAFIEGTVPADLGPAPESQIDLAFSLGARLAVW